MKQKILATLKNKYAHLGLSREALDGVASVLEKTINSEDEIETANNRIVMETIDYNKDVVDYNATASTFPGNVIVDIFGYEQSALVFEIIDVSRG